MDDKHEGAAIVGRDRCRGADEDYADLFDTLDVCTSDDGGASEGGN